MNGRVPVSCCHFLPFLFVTPLFPRPSVILSAAKDPAPDAGPVIPVLPVSSVGAVHERPVPGPRLCCTAQRPPPLPPLKGEVSAVRADGGVLSPPTKKLPAPKRVRGDKLCACLYRNQTKSQNAMNRPNTTANTSTTSRPALMAAQVYMRCSSLVI